MARGNGRPRNGSTRPHPSRSSAPRRSCDPDGACTRFRRRGCCTPAWNQCGSNVIRAFARWPDTTAVCGAACAAANGAKVRSGILSVGADAAVCEPWNRNGGTALSAELPARNLRLYVAACLSLRLFQEEPFLIKLSEPERQASCLGTSQQPRRAS